jgi:hypothetical protein
MPKLSDLKRAIEKSGIDPQQRLQETLRAQQEDMNRRTVELVRAEMMREAETRIQSQEVHDLAIQHREELRQLREESDVAARKYFWKGVVAGVVVSALFTLVSWLLSAVNAVQVLSNLLHH